MPYSTRPAIAIMLVLGAAAVVASWGDGRAAAADIRTLAARCAPLVSPLTMEALARAESRLDPWAIHVNGGYALPRPPATLAEAQATAAWLSQHGYSFDIGLMQVNSANFARLGTSANDLLDPCTSLAAGAMVLRECYGRAVARFGPGQEGLHHALSCYNTGSMTQGMDNGYVARLVNPVATGQAPQVLRVPALEHPAAPSPDRRGKDASPPDRPADTPSDMHAPANGTPDAFDHAPGDVFSPPEPVPPPEPAPPHGQSHAQSPVSSPTAAQGG